MPADAMILSAAIVAVFVIFGSVLYWGERRTRDFTGLNRHHKRNWKIRQHPVPIQEQS
jgi:hypothetical protein